MNKEHKLSPLFILTEFISNYKLLFPIIFFLKDTETSEVLIILGIILANFALHTIRYFRTTYKLVDDVLIFKSGLFTISEKHINFSNIQNIDTSEKLIYQLFNLVSLDINIINETVKLEPLTKKDANRIISFINKREVIAKEDNNFLVHLSLKDLMLMSVLKSRMFLTLIAIFAFADDVIKYIDKIFSINTFSYFEKFGSGIANDITSVLIFLVVALLILFIISFIRNMISFYDFRLENKDDKLICKFGITNKKAVVIKKERIQSITISRPFRYRLFGLSNLSVVTTASNVLDGISSGNHIAVIPIAKDDFVNNFIKNILEIDINKYDKEQYEYIPKKANAILLRGIAIRSLVGATIISLLIYFIPVFKDSFALSIKLGIGLIILYIIFAIFNYRFMLKHSSIALSDGIIVRNRTLSFEKATDYQKPTKVGNIDVRSNVLLKRKNLCHITINSIGSGSDIVINYFDRSYVDKIHNYLIAQGEKNNAENI